MQKDLEEKFNEQNLELSNIIPPSDLKDILRFWLRIMYEHAIFIEGEWPHFENEKIIQVQQFQREYRELLERLERTNPINIINPAGKVTISFRNFLLDSLTQHLTCKIATNTLDLLFDHMKREADEFLFVLDIVKKGIQLTPIEAGMHENIFWLKVMADHAKFIMHYLDPSNRLVVFEMSEFSVRFDNLYLQAIELQSMLERFTNRVIPVLDTFNKMAIDETSKLRDLKLKFQRLRETCAVATTAPIDLLEHIAREASYYIENLKMLRVR